MKNISRRDMLKMTGMVFAGATLASCAPAAAPAGSPTTTPVKADPVKVVMIESWFGVPQYAETIAPITQALSEKAQAEGVNVVFESMILDDHANKYAALYAAGSEFTCAFDAPWNKMNTLRDQKALVAIEDLINTVGPRLKEEITQKIFDFNFENGPDGKRHLYGIPTAYYYGGTTGVTIREDLRLKYNLPAPDPSVGWASFESYLEGIAANEKGMTPFANTAKYPPVVIPHMSQGYWNWGPLGEDVGLAMRLSKFEKGEYVFAETEKDEGMIARTEMLRSWWEKGWINRADLPLTGGTETVEKDFLVPGKAASCMQNDAEVKAWQEFDPMMKQANPDAELKGYDMTGLSTGKFKGMGGLKQWNFIVFNASATVEAQTAGIQWFDWLASSQDNIDLWLMGIEGTNWKKEDNMRYSDIDGTDPSTNYRRQWYVSGISGRFQRQALNISPEAEAIIKANSTEENWVFNPYESFSIDRKPLEEVMTKIVAIRDEAAHGMNTGQLTAEEALAKYQKMMDEAGRQQLKEMMQKQIDDYIASV